LEPLNIIKQPWCVNTNIIIIAAWSNELPIASNVCLQIAQHGTFQKHHSNVRCVEVYLMQCGLLNPTAWRIENGRLNTPER